MRILTQIVKPLAQGSGIWHPLSMTNSKNIKADAKAERLAAALRANLRLRKAQSRIMDNVGNQSNGNEANSESTETEIPKK